MEDWTNRLEVLRSRTSWQTESKIGIVLEKRVIVEGYFGDWKPVSSGVLKRAVLEPLLFVININNRV